MSTNKTGERPTPQSLPRLRIPEGRYKMEPEEITTSRAESFLNFCQKHKKAPLTRLPTIALIPLPESETDSEDQGKQKGKEESRSSSDRARAVKEDGGDKTPTTLDFTLQEWVELDAKKAAYEEAKAQHTNWILEVQADPRDREAIRTCKRWRLERERLHLEMELILGHRKIRREFRRDFNNIPGLKGW
ncbi:hypothetical protein AAE478_010470 [Parahypoxylon ruwenzoriense]